MVGNLPHSPSLTMVYLLKNIQYLLPSFTGDLTIVREKMHISNILSINTNEYLSHISGIFLFMKITWICKSKGLRVKCYF